MIKVPGTSEGLPAIQQLIAEGINVNITLLFAQERYVEVAQAYISGLEQRAAQNGDVSHVASVASFFISRIDTLVDKKLGALLGQTSDGKQQATIKSLMGKIAIANGKQTYQQYKTLFSNQRWDALAKKGAMPQRVLWASTSTKNPEYRDVLYIEELIGPSTVNTIPPATYDAFRDHGKAQASLEADIDAANKAMDALATVGVSMEEVTDTLLEEAIRLFKEPFDKLLTTIKSKGNIQDG
jgi:transaldolase